MALSSAFFTSTAMRLRENSRSASARSTFLPRISCASRFSFCGLMRSMRATALASLSSSPRSFFALAMSGPLRLLVRGVAMERAGRRELAELMTDHVLRHVHRDMLVAVMHAEGQADELRQDGRAPAPNLDHFRTAGRARIIRFFEQITVDERALPNRASHYDQPFLRACREDTMNFLVDLFLRVFLPLVGLPHGVTG